MDPASCIDLRIILKVAAFFLFALSRIASELHISLSLCRIIRKLFILRYILQCLIPDPLSIWPLLLLHNGSRRIHFFDDIDHMIHRQSIYFLPKEIIFLVNDSNREDHVQDDDDETIYKGEYFFLGHFDIEQPHEAAV